MLPKRKEVESSPRPNLKIFDKKDVPANPKGAGGIVIKSVSESDQPPTEPISV